MNRSILGKRRSIRICLAPAVARAPGPVLFASGLARRRFSSPSDRWRARPMLNRPMRVSFITSAADMAQTMASHASRRAARAGSTGRKCSSMNSIVAITMSPCAMSCLAAGERRAVFPPLGGGMEPTASSRACFAQGSGWRARRRWRGGCPS
jgi:hypothetical protein